MRTKVVQMLRALKKQGGFSVIEVVVSAVLLGTTATGTFVALDSATKSNYRNARSTAAFLVASSEMERLRRLGDVNVATLLAQDLTTRYVVVKGITYRVDTRAYYKSGIGATFTDACGEESSGSGANSGAKYVYISAAVTLPPNNTSGTGATGGLVSAAFLDAYFATEGGDLQTASGTLRVYIKGPAPAEVSQVGMTVELYKMPAGTLTANATTNSLGCVLFIGMQRGDYEVRVPTTTKTDKYGNTNPVRLTVKMPSRGALTRTINIATPVTVNLNWYTRLTAGNPTKTYVTPPSSPLPNLVGPFVVMNPGFTDVIPSGYSFRTNASNLQFYPIDPAEGYSLYAGSCVENDPDDGNAGNGAERFVIPATGSTGWTEGGTYSPNPELLVPQFKIRVGEGTLSSWATGAKVQVKQVAGSCGAYPSGGATNWIRLTGTTDSNGYLANNAYVLPAGAYDVCVRHDRRVFLSTNEYYGSATAVTNPFPGPNNYSYATSSSTACGNSSLW